MPTTIDPTICPLCKANNACVNVTCGGSAEKCWCSDANVSFPASLLEQLPSNVQGKACICKACALAYKK
jgi:hypothetical protein